jgi:phosphoribosylaminoimidazolecarboxamide formyltransferase/IMP cyclohydrolase
MGGVLVCNHEVTADFASEVMGTYDRLGRSAGAGGFFVEVWVAPSFEAPAVEAIRNLKGWGRRVRLVPVGSMDVAPDALEPDWRKLYGGLLVQDRDLLGLNESAWETVTKCAPSEAELADLRLAWLVCKHTKSNAITICRDGMLLGNGAGQTSRVVSCRIATWAGRNNGHESRLAGSAAASDAFFPFRDGPDILIEAGVRAIIQPGGSKRDADTVAACDERGVVMIFTGARHFRH